MARFTADQASNYGGQGGGGFFSLRDDKDKAQVRFLYNRFEDVLGDSVHELTYKRDDGREGKKYVNCLREYNDPVDKCPFCREGKPVKAKLFVPLYDEASGKTLTWERGKKFFSKMSSICSRYATEKTPLVSHVFEIERSGAQGDQNTSYEIYEIDCDDTTLEDLPEPADLSNYLLNKSADDMEFYLENRSFPPSGDDEEFEERPVRRRNDSREGRGGRRTPAGRRGDVF